MLLIDPSGWRVLGGRVSVAIDCYFPCATQPYVVNGQRGKCEKVNTYSASRIWIFIESDGYPCRVCGHAGS